MKNGPPTIDKIIPTGISNGANTHLHNKSLNVRNNAPKTIVPSILLLLLFLMKYLTICGTINPIKPNNPIKLTADAANKAARSKNIAIYILGFKPILFATSIPSDKTSIFLEIFNNIIIDIIITYFDV